MTMREYYKKLPRSDRKLAFAVILGVIVVSLIPYIYGAVHAGSSYTYLWMNPITSAGDSNVYYSLITQAAQGNVFLENLYTGEAQNGSMFHPLWLVLGWVSGLFHISAPIIYQAVRILLGIWFLLYLYYWISEFTRHHRRIRNIAFVVAACSSGLGWMFATSIGHLDPIKILYLLPTDQWVSEANTFLSIFHSPLFILSQLLMLFIIHQVVYMRDMRHGGLLLCAVFALALMHPYDLFILGAILPAFMLVRLVRSNPSDSFHFKQGVKLLFFIAAAAIPAALYLIVTGLTEEAIGGWTKQNITISPPAHSYIIGFGFVLLFAVLGWVLRHRSRRKEDILLLVWPLVAITLMYLPLQINRRFVNGLHISLAVLAGIGIEYCLHRWQLSNHKISMQFMARSALIWIVSLGLFMGNAILIGNTIYWEQNRDQTIYYVPRSVANAMDWLGKNAGRDDVVLSTTFHGNVIPARTGLRVYAGHGHQTLRWEEKRDTVYRWFFQVNTQDAEKRRFLRSANITYLLVADNEDLGDFRAHEKDYLVPVFHEGHAWVYRIAL